MTDRMCKNRSVEDISNNNKNEILTKNTSMIPILKHGLFIVIQTHCVCVGRQLIFCICSSFEGEINGVKRGNIEMRGKKLESK